MGRSCQAHCPSCGPRWLRLRLDASCDPCAPQTGCSTPSCQGRARGAACRPGSLGETGRNLRDELSEQEGLAPSLESASQSPATGLAGTAPSGRRWQTAPPGLPPRNRAALRAPQPLHAVATRRRCTSGASTPLDRHSGWSGQHGQPTLPRGAVSGGLHRRIDAAPPTHVVHFSCGICSITQKGKSVVGCSTPNRLSLDATCPR